MKNSDILRKCSAIGLMLAVSVSGFAQTTITDEAGLKAIANDLSGKYVLANDISLSGEWTPLGTEDEPFTGTLDGAGHTIKGLSITSGADNVGFFGFTEGATVKNVRFTGAKVLGNKQVGILAGQAISSNIETVFTAGYLTGYDHVGGIVGDARGDANSDQMTYITNCMSTAGAFGTTCQAGTIAGWTNAGVFTNNIAYGAATAPSGGAGAITGMLDNDGIASYVSNVSAVAFLTGANNRTHAINAWKNGSGCVYGDVSDNLASDKTIYTVGGAVVTADQLADDANNEGVQGTVVSDADLMKAETYQNIGFDGSVWNLTTGTYPVLQGMTLPIDGDAIRVNELPDKCVLAQQFETGALSALGRTVTITSSNPSVVQVEGTVLKFLTTGNSTVTLSTTGDSFCNGATITLDITVTDINYALTTPEDLMNMSYNLAGDFTLENDIDMSGYDWKPVGEFTGTFDGKGHFIKNISFDNADQGEVAIFSTTRNAQIRNLGVMNANFVGNANVAAIVGRAYGGVIENCAVLGSYIEGRDHVASIAGDVNKNDADEGAIVRNCLSDSRISSRSYQAGGMVGTIVTGTVEKCLFSGTVDCAGNATGMVSLIDDDALPSYIRNNMIAPSHLYGTVSRVVATAGRTANLENNYALESSFCGSSAANAGPMENENDATSIHGANVADADARTQNFYENTLGWDFQNIWKFIEGTEGKMYPVLKWMNAPLPSVIYDMPQNKSILYVSGMEFIDLACIHGSLGQTLDIQIVEGGDIACIYQDDLYAGDENAQFVGRGDVVLKVTPTPDVADKLTMSGSDSFSVYIGREGDLTPISTAQEFIDINKNLAGDYELTQDIDLTGVDFPGIGVSGESFTGSINGNGHKVIGARVSFSSGSDVGVFGKTNGATIKNIAFVDYVVSASACNHVGLVGSASVTTFDQVAAVGTVTGDDHVALFAGDGNGSTVTNCYVDGTVTGRSQVGGFFGCTLESGANISNSYFNGQATATFRGWTGGFIGLIDKAESLVDIHNCVSIGNCSTTGSGSPLVTAPFIAGNNAGDTPNAVINFSGNLYNNEAVMDATTEWPTKNETAEGGSVEPATPMTVAALQQESTYTGIGWDFANVWMFDKESGYSYPVLKQFGAIITGIEDVNTGENAAGAYAVHASGNVLVVAGLGAQADVTVATLAGQNIASLTTRAGSATITLPGKGIYIVKIVENGSAKAVKVVNR